MNKKINLKAAVLAGTAAGITSGLVKLGWENILPPRTPQRNKTNPPQKMLEQLGIPSSITHATYKYSRQELPYVSYIIHFGFSASFAIIYEVLIQYKDKLRAGSGTIFGLAVWITYHLLVMPAMKTIPSAKEQPFEEHLSEALGHIAWMWTNDVVGQEIYNRLAKKD
ncbi:YagU family protein [Companilactobacillus sp. DQM5]|uniref:YagU family protein n=1 Tax=Companilactobacillus sp. DQM5 TaxID=3463359 RepID=UPI004058F894